MTSRPTFVPEAARVERLLRLLVGVADVRLHFESGSGVRAIEILRDGRVQEHQLIRNVISALKAGFGLRLEPAQVTVFVENDAFVRSATDEQAAAPVPAVEQAAARRAPSTSRMGRPHGTANGNGASVVSNGNGKLAHPQEPVAAEAASHDRFAEPAVGRGGSRDATIRDRTPSARPIPGDVDRRPRLESVDVERHAMMLRCRVSVRLGDRVFVAVSEVRDAPSAEAELAARVTLEALRAGGLTNDQLEGVALTSIAGNVFVVAAVRSASRPAPRACAAPLVHTMAAAAAEAALRAHGPIVPPTRALSTGSGH
jgi:hypothetical protein